MEYNYENIRKEVLFGHELHFYYKEKQYSISYNQHGWYLTEFNNPDYLTFSSAESLFDSGKIGGKTLEEIWDDIEIDTLF